MLTVKDLADKFKISKRSVSRRLAALGLDKDGENGTYIERGKGDKYLITDNGVSIFNRLIELENEGYKIQDAAKKVRSEVGEGNKIDTNGQENSKSTIADKRLNRDELVTSLRDQIDLLKMQVDRKDKQIERLQDILNSRLPGRSSDAVDDTQVDYLQSIIAKQREEIERLKQEGPTLWQRLASWFTSEKGGKVEGNGT